MLQLRFINTKRERKTITLQTQNASKPDGRSTPGTDGRRRAFATFSFLLNGKWTDFPIHLLMLKKTKLFILKYTRSSHHCLPLSPMSAPRPSPPS